MTIIQVLANTINFSGYLIFLLESSFCFPDLDFWDGREGVKQHNPIPCGDRSALHLFPLSNDMLNLVPPFTAMDGLRIATWILFDTDILQFYISIPS